MSFPHGFQSRPIVIFGQNPLALYSWFSSQDEYNENQELFTDASISLNNLGKLLQLNDLSSQRHFPIKLLLQIFKCFGTFLGLLCLYYHSASQFDTYVSLNIYIFILERNTCAGSLHSSPSILSQIRLKTTDEGCQWLTSHYSQ